MTTAGVSNVTALLSAHRTALLSEGVELRLNVSRTHENGTLAARSNQTLQIGPGGLPVVINGSGTSLSGQLAVDTWLNETTTLFRVRGGEETTYRIQPPVATPAELVWAGNLRPYISEAAPTFRVDSMGDGTVVLLAENVSVPGGQTTVQLLLTTEGLIRWVVVEQRQPDGQTLRLHYEVSRVGVSPEQPAWVASIPAGVFLDVDLDVDTTDGTGFALSNRGSDAVPVGSTVSFAVEGREYDVTLSSGVPAGESLWVWVDESNTLRAGPDQPTTARRLESPGTIVVRAPDGTRLLTAELAWRAPR